MGENENGVKFDKIIHLLLVTKSDSDIHFSKPVEENVTIENQDIQIYAGHYTFSQEASAKESYGTDWRLPCGIVEYQVEQKQVRKTCKKKNIRFFCIFFVCLEKHQTTKSDKSPTRRRKRKRNGKRENDTNVVVKK